MAKFAYNNAKNANTNHMLFNLNRDFHLCIFFKEDINPHSQSKTANKLLTELQKLMIICQENLHYAQELQKQAYNKDVKSRSYSPGDKVWLNSIYIKTK